MAVIRKKPEDFLKQLCYEKKSQRYPPPIALNLQMHFPIWCSADPWPLDILAGIDEDIKLGKCGLQYVGTTNKGSLPSCQRIW